MSNPSPQAALAAWWERRCGRYLRESIGPVEGEVRGQLSRLLFPPAAEPTLPEESLPIAFAHLRLLAGEDLGVVLQRMEGLARLFGSPGARVRIGTLYLLLSALTSTPGRLSSLAQAQTAFFSLLLRRLADLLDRGVAEDTIRRELTETWGIQAEQAAGLALDGARALWRRVQDPRLGLQPLPFDLDAWLAANGLTEAAGAARRLFVSAAEHPHLAPLIERLAAAEAARAAVDQAAPAERLRALAEGHAALLESVRGAAESLIPWEAEGLRPAVPLLSALQAWSGRLQLLEGGETPTAQPGRERLPDWLREFLAKESPEEQGVLAAGRFTVGSGTYLAAGVDAKAPAETVAVTLALEAKEGEAPSLALRFGSGEERRFPFRLEEGRELLAALHFADQPDVRLDLVVRGEDGLWRFGASLYLVPKPEERGTWTRAVLAHLHSRFGGEEDRIKIEILKAVKKGEG